MTSASGKVHVIPDDGATYYCCACDRPIAVGVPAILHQTVSSPGFTIVTREHPECAAPARSEEERR